MKPALKKTDRGAILYDPGLVGEATEQMFRVEYWRQGDAVVGTAEGRGTTWIVAGESGPWALRHFQRGGWFSRFNRDTYLWMGESSTRPFREWHLLAELRRRGLPVPVPVAARYWRRGCTYRGDLITAFVPDTASLAQKCDDGHVDEELWSSVGVTLRQFHDAGVDHADLNANNILIDGGGRVFLIDFDRGQLRQPGSWAKRNLNRLERSLRKVATMRGGAFPAVGWRALRSGYDRA